jgi:putative endonuclease
MHDYYVYILTNRSYTVLYTGVTNDIERRLAEHRDGEPGSFTARYKVTLLAHLEATDDVWAALEREKQIKGWSRAKKVALIEASNPDWRDLSVDLYVPLADA